MRVPSAAPSFRGLGIGHDQVLTVLLENGAIREFAEAKRGEAEEVHALYRGSEWTYKRRGAVNETMKGEGKYSEWTYERRGAVNEPMKGEGKYKSSECIYERRGEL